MRESLVVRKILQAINAEPECPGEMPDEMWTAINNDRDAATKTLQLTVKLAKEGIAKRIFDNMGKLFNDSVKDL